MAASPPPSSSSPAPLELTTSTTPSRSKKKRKDGHSSASFSSSASSSPSSSRSKRLSVSISPASSSSPKDLRSSFDSTASTASTSCDTPKSSRRTKASSSSSAQPGSNGSDDSLEERDDSKPETDSYDDEGQFVKSNSFWGRLFGKKRIAVEEFDKAEFVKLEKMRQKERSDYLTQQSSVAGLAIKDIEEQEDEPLVILDPPPSGADLIKIIGTLSDLPPDMMASVQKMGIPLDQLEKNLEILLPILTFSDHQRPKRRFYTRETFAIVSAPGFRQQKNIHPPRMGQAHKDLFKRIRLHQAKKIYRVRNFLGEGAFGGVVAATLLQRVHGPDVKKVAIKFQRLTTKADQLQIQHEASMMIFCNHPGIVKMYSGLQVRDESWILMELLSGGTLKQAATCPAPWKEPEIGYIADKLLQAVKYLHDNQIIHMDLKNLNIMFTEDAQIKLIDFGLAADITHGPIKRMCGSPFWMSPEMIRGDYHSYPTDIWSAMICLLELANRRPPNFHNKKRALYLTATEGVGPNCGLEKPEAWSDAFKSFLSAGTMIDQNARATAAQLLDHPFLDEIATQKQMEAKLSAIFARAGAAASGL